MSQPIHYTNCPFCSAAAIGYQLTATDHTVSKREFPIWKCENCGLLFTQDIPTADEIGAYYKSEEYISHTDTSKGIVNSLYQVVRRRTLVQKRKLIERITGRNKGSLLDIGAGTGAFAGEMQRRGWKVTALEPDESARNKALELHDISALDSSALFQLAAGSFDAVTMWHVLEHVHDLHSYVSKLRELLNPGGKIFIAVPNHKSGDATTYGKWWAAYDVPRHLYHFSPDSMEILMKKHGMKIEKMLPMWFDSFYVSMLSSRYRGDILGLPRAFINGLMSNIRAWGNRKNCSSLIYVISVG